KMPMPSWATKEQQAWLTEYQQKHYLPLMEKRDYTGFWNPFYEAFGEKWPERDLLFPGIPQADLTPKQLETLKTAIADRKKQKLMNWMRTHSRPKKPTTGTVKLPELLSDEPERCNLTPLEVFSKLFYHSHVKESAQAAAQKDGDEEIPVDIIRKMTIAAWRDVQASDPETTRKVMEEYERRKSQKVQEIEEKDNPTPDQIASAIRRSPALIIAALQHVQQSTGWSYTLLFGGPDPDMGGSLRLGRCVHFVRFISFTNINKD
ncbi:hypothetical protein EV363DRAFT_1163288, partial [Boletus edulis]